MHLDRVWIEKHRQLQCVAVGEVAVGLKRKTNREVLRLDTVEPSIDAEERNDRAVELVRQPRAHLLRKHLHITGRRLDAQLLDQVARLELETIEDLEQDVVNRCELPLELACHVDHPVEARLATLVAREQTLH